MTDTALVSTSENARKKRIPQKLSSPKLTWLANASGTGQFIEKTVVDTKVNASSRQTG